MSSPGGRYRRGRWSPTSSGFRTIANAGRLGLAEPARPKARRAECWGAGNLPWSGWDACVCCVWELRRVSPSLCEPRVLVPSRAVRTPVGTRTRAGHERSLGWRLLSQRPGINPVAYLTDVEASIVHISESEGHIPDGRVALFNTSTPRTSFVLLCYSLELCFYLEGTGWVAMGYGLLKGIQNIGEACPWSYSYRLDSSSYFLPHSVRLDIVTWPHLTVREAGKCHLAEAQEHERQMMVGCFRSLVEPISSSSDEVKSHIFLPCTWLMLNPRKPLLLIVVAVSDKHKC